MAHNFRNPDANNEKNSSCIIRKLQKFKKSNYQCFRIMQWFKSIKKDISVLKEIKLLCTKFAK